MSHVSSMHIKSLKWGEKDGKPIGERSFGFVINRSCDRHNLILLVLRKKFFGVYSYRARNVLGWPLSQHQWQVGITNIKVTFLFMFLS